MYYLVFGTPWGYIPDNNRAVDTATALRGEETTYRDLEQQSIALYKVYDDYDEAPRALYHLVEGLFESNKYVWLADDGADTYRQDSEIMDTETAAAVLIASPTVDRAALADLDVVDPRLAAAVKLIESGRRGGVDRCPPVGFAGGRG